MKWLLGWWSPIRMMSDNRGGPWGAGGGDEGGEGGGGDGGGRNPWGQPGGGRRRRAGRTGEVTSLDDFLKKSRERFGRRFPVGGGDGRPYWAYGLAAFVLLWIAFTSIHRIGPQERGVVTIFGEYDRTIVPGIGLSWPSPIGRVQVVDFDRIRTITIPENSGTENLILTGDQNVIDLAYSVRWSVRDPQGYLFQIADPEETIREVAESVMRAVVARVSLEDAIGAGRGDIEQNVAQNMQQLLDAYRAGIFIQGVSINQSGPPSAVNEAFLEVSAAQQRAQSTMNQARAYATQITARAQGDAAAFDKVYTEYRSAPEVTRRRMYYETMERILSRVDTTLVEAPGVTPYLPLPEVARRASPQPQGTGR
ncbi:MAG: protease modulator HflK [Sphingosinicella sp.]